VDVATFSFGASASLFTTRNRSSLPSCPHKSAISNSSACNSPPFVFRNGRGHIYIEEGRLIFPPGHTISRIHVLNDARIALADNDRRRLRMRVALAIFKILQSTELCFLHSSDTMRTAVLYLENFESRIAAFDSSWGAVAWLWRILRHRTPRPVPAPSVFFFRSAGPERSKRPETAGPAGRGPRGPRVPREAGDGGGGGRR